MSETLDLSRLRRRDPVSRTPVPVEGEPGLVTVDATWGKLQPLRLAPELGTVAELELIEHIRAGDLLVDTRQPNDVAAGTLPTAIAVRHQEILTGLAPHAGRDPIVLFCNGPQCLATPQAIEALLGAGWEAARLRYYRGGIHDWVTLGLPLARV